MKGRQQFAPAEVVEIRSLLAAKVKASRDEQKRIRGEIRRRYGFFISDFSDSGAFGPLDFDALIQSRQISISGQSPVNLNSSLASSREESSAPISRSKLGSERIGRQRAESDECYVIDLCDEIVGEKALRQHRFAFLKGDGGSPLPVDAFYPNLKLVVEYRERQHSEAVGFFDRRQTVSGVPRGEQRRLYDQRRREILPANGITLVEIDFSDLSHSSRKRLNKDRTYDQKILSSKLAISGRAQAGQDSSLHSG